MISNKFKAQRTLLAFGSFFVPLLYSCDYVRLYSLLYKPLYNLYYLINASVISLQDILPGSHTDGLSVKRSGLFFQGAWVLAVGWPGPGSTSSHRGGGVSWNPRAGYI